MALLERNASVNAAVCAAVWPKQSSLMTGQQESRPYSPGMGGCVVSDLVALRGEGSHAWTVQAIHGTNIWCQIRLFWGASLCVFALPGNWDAGLAMHGANSPKKCKEGGN